jgi:competence protein ComEC
VTGLHVSSVRAAIMSAVFLGGFVVERRHFTLNALAAAAVLLLVWNTNELFSTGFQLSFAVVAAIVILVAPLTTFFGHYTAPDPFLPRSLSSKSSRLVHAVLSKVTQSVAVSFAAWAGSLGLLLWYFYLITPVSLLANVIVVPIAFAILAVALMSVLVAPVFPWVSLVFNNANWFLAKVVIWIVHLFALMPAGHYYLPHPPGLGTASAKITVLDLGAGAAVHLHTRHQDWLFDCGSERDYDRSVREYLHSAGVNRLNALLLTHGDAQHIGGAIRLLSQMRPGMVIDNPAPDRSSVHKRLRQLFDQKQLRLVRPVQNQNVALGDDITCAVLYPPVSFSAPVGDDQTLVTQLRFGSGPRVLFLSDSGMATESALLTSNRTDLRSEIVIKGQHHSGKSGSAEFLQAVQPRVVVATSRDFPRHERIDEQWAEQLRGQNVQLFRQDQTGAVEIRFWPEHWEARGYADGATFRSSSR